MQAKLDLATDSASLLWWEWEVPSGRIGIHENGIHPLGYQGDEILDQLEGWLDKVHPDDRSEAGRMIATIMSGEVVRTGCDLRMEAVDQSWRWMQLQGRVMKRDADGRPEWVLGTMRDIHVRRMAQERLEQSEERFRMVFEGSGIGLAMVGVDGEVREFNAAWERILGCKKEDIYPPSIEEWRPVEDRDDDRALRAVLLGREHDHIQVETRFRTCSGAAIWTLLTVSLVCSRAGNPLHFVYQIQDLTAQREAKEALLRAKEDAESALRAKAEFLAVMSHEIRTPLNPILGVTQLLLDTSTDDEQRELLGLVFTASNQLLTLLTDILDLAKVETGRMTVRKIPLRMDSLLSDVFEAKRDEARRRKLDLRLEVGDGLGTTFLGDPQRLRQVLLNVMGNAVKFTERGRVELRASRMSTPILNDQGIEVLRTWVRIEVEDTGIGIDPAHLPRLFEPFNQADSSYSRRYEGSGLGLSICKRLVEIMGGCISVASKPGAGTTVTLAIPFEVDEDEAPSESESPTTGAAAPGRRPQVLLAEDDASNRAVLTAMLRRLNCDVLHARNGREAVEVFAEKGADLILMDLHMPVMDGYAATVEIRRSGPRGEEVPIIAQTANAFSSDRESCLAAGMQGFITKPVNLAELRRILRAHVTRPSPAAPGSTPAQR